MNIVMVIALASGMNLVVPYGGDKEGCELNSERMNATDNPIIERTYCASIIPTSPVVTAATAK